MTFEHLAFRAASGLFRAAYRLRRLGGPARTAPAPSRATRPAGAPRARNVLLITVDQQRYDALGVNGGQVARTPRLDRLAREGINYRRAHVQNVVCMPSRTTMLTGQHPYTHGVIANGIPTPLDAPSVAALLRERAGYRTAIVGKAHFDPHLDPTLRFFENRCAAQGSTGPWHGFEHLELSTHGPVSGQHYAAWLWEEHPEAVGGFAAVLSGDGGGDTGAPEVAHNPIPRELYHTDWVADRTLAWLKDQPDEEPWFCWMSFPDPHHPFDPPLDEVRRRIPNWRDVPLPEGYLPPGEAERVLASKPRHWLDWYQGRYRNPEGGPIAFVPGQLSADQLREINAMIHVENELIDDAVGRVLDWLSASGLNRWTDVFYTSDHGELQGDHGLLFKGPYHVESLLRVPFLWRPAPEAGIAPAEVTAPVGHVDLAPTICRAAGLDVPEWMQGQPLPTDADAQRERVLTTFDSQFAAVGMHLQTICRDGYLCTAYGPRTRGVGGRFPVYWSIWGRGSQVPTYDGSEGELYELEADPHQRINLWDDPARQSLKRDLLADLRASLPAPRTPPLKVAAPT